MGAIVLRTDTRERLQTCLIGLLRDGVPGYIEEFELLDDLLALDPADDPRWRKLTKVMARFIGDYIDCMDFMMIDKPERERRVVDVFMEFAAGVRAGAEIWAPGQRYFEPPRLGEGA